MPPKFERILTDRYCLLLGSVAYFTHVQRLRLGPGGVEGAVSDIRAHIAKRGRAEAKWWIGDSATPTDLHERLLALGFEPEPSPGDSRATAMALVEPPKVPESDVVVRRVATIDELATAEEIAFEAFGWPEERRAATREDRAHEWRRERIGYTETFLAFVDGQAVASARAVVRDEGLLLIGGGTLPWARGRGAYRALVRARWQEAARLGTPALVVQAGAMSRPILERLGFQKVAGLRILFDKRA